MLPVFGLVRTSLGFVLLDRDGMAALARLGRRGAAGPRPRSAAALPPHCATGGRAGPKRRWRRWRWPRSHRLALPRMLATHAAAGDRLPERRPFQPDGRAALGAWRALPGARVAVMIHDTIPLDFPESQRPGIGRELSRAGWRRFRAGADLVDLCLGRAPGRCRTPHAAAPGRVPPGHRRADRGRPAARPTPPRCRRACRPRRPISSTLGTIEPRKNHALLLDIWDALCRRGAVPASADPRPPRLETTPRSSAASTRCRRDGLGARGGGTGRRRRGGAARRRHRAADAEPRRGLRPAGGRGGRRWGRRSSLPTCRSTARSPETCPVYLRPAEMYPWASKITDNVGYSGSWGGDCRPAAGSGFRLGRTISTWS